jgi:2-polyprenyl-6-hydroxyphenyl methylase/3-demethylubiquinone-9 3-methyltransferase
VSRTVRRRRNDVRQYDDLETQWWDPRGEFAMLHWIARARAGLIPAATHPQAVLLDLACGGGLMAPYALERGYVHIGIDITASALQIAQQRGVAAVRGDVLLVPIQDASVDVVTVGEILEHVLDPMAVVREAVRVLRPGGRIVIDTIADTWQARLLAVAVAERIPGLAPRGIHDPNLFIDRQQLVRQCEELGIVLRLQGLRVDLRSLAKWRRGTLGAARMVATRSTAVVFQAWGYKPSAQSAPDQWVQWKELV